MPLGATFEPQGSVAGAIQAGKEGAMSMMERAQAQKVQEYAFQQKQIQDALRAPIEQAKAQVDFQKATNDYNQAIQEQDQRSIAIGLKNDADQDFHDIIATTDPQQRLDRAIEWAGKYSQLANVSELKDSMTMRKQMLDSVIGDAKTVLDAKRKITAETQTFNDLTAGMSAEDKSQAARVKAGLAAKPSSAAIQYKVVTGPDGAPQIVAVNPREVGAVGLGTGETTGSAFGGSQNIKPSASLMGQSTEAEAAAKDKAKRESDLKAAKPKRQAALAQAETLADRLTEDIDSLISRVSSSTVGPGGVLLEKFPGTAAKDFSNDLTTIKANIGFQALQAMREASPTGGALGQVSDFENKNLQAVLGSLDIGSSPQKFIENLKKVKKNLNSAFGASKAAFQSEYGVDSSGSSSNSFKDMSTQELQDRLNKIQGAK